MLVNRWNTGTEIYRHVYGTTCYILLSSGLTVLPGNFGPISETSTSDYDKDGLSDSQEINWDCPFIMYDSNGKLQLPKFNECMEFLGEDKFYIISALDRLRNTQDCYTLEALGEVTILPIKSDPTNVDGDGDGVSDINDNLKLQYYAPFYGENLSSEEAEICYSLISLIIPIYDEYGETITNENCPNECTDNYFNEFIWGKTETSTFDYVEAYSAWLDSTYGEVEISEFKIMLDDFPIAKQVLGGNYCPNDITVAGTGTQIIIGFTNCDVAFDVRDVLYDFTHFKPNKEWAGQTLVDLLAFAPVIGSLKYCDELKALSKVENTKIANKVLEGSIDASGTIFKSSDELTESVQEVAKTVSKAKSIGIKDETAISKIIENAAEAVKNNTFDCKKMVGKDFEDYLTDLFGGTGSFKLDGREFDGRLGEIWWEAKSGNYWELISNDSKKLDLFKSSMGDRLRIAKTNGATYALISNSPIPEDIKLWLTKKGIPYTEL